MPKRVRGVLIDFVGTLVSFKADPDAALEEMHAELVRRGTSMPLERFSEAYGAAHLKYRKVRHEELIEVSNEVWIRDALHNLGVDGSEGELPRFMADAYFSSFVKGASVLPGVVETLRYLEGRGYRLAVVSNFSYSPVPERLLEQFALGRYFEAVIISEAIGYRKPHPAIFREAVRRLRIGTDEAVMVGDTPTEDVYGAKKIGMTAYQVREASLPGYYTPYLPDRSEDAKYLKPDAVLTGFSDLKDLL